MILVLLCWTVRKNVRVYMEAVPQAGDRMTFDRKWWVVRRVEWHDVDGGYRPHLILRKAS